VVRARNRALRETSGECVLFLDSDDRLRPRAFQSGGLRRSPNAAFSYGWSDLITPDGSLLGHAHRFVAEGDLYASLLRQSLLQLLTMMFRRGQLETVGAFSIGVDWG
jgi:glycosyltransferase involved in cell wall biosynthesis